MSKLTKEQEDQIVNKILSLLTEKPEMFTARWINKYALENSVQSTDRNILIFRNGEILKPIKTELEEPQKTKMRNAVAEIYKRDSDLFVNDFLRKY